MALASMPLVRVIAPATMAVISVTDATVDGLAQSVTWVRCFD
jgi:hypothetical protein